MKIRMKLALAAVVLLAACTNDPALTNPNLGIPSNFFQIELNGQSFVINLFTPWADHPAINQSGPSATGPLPTDIVAFMTTTAGRSAAIAAQTKSVLVPGVLVADLSQSGGASFLGVETQGKLNQNGTVCGSASSNASPCTGGLFGGRGINDDLGAELLGVAFGPTIPQIFTTVPDDGKEQTGAGGTPNLANDNIPAAQHPNVIGVFPYLGAPH